MWANVQIGARSVVLALPAVAVVDFEVLASGTDVFLGARASERGNAICTCAAMEAGRTATFVYLQFTSEITKFRVNSDCNIIYYIISVVFVTHGIVTLCIQATKFQLNSLDVVLWKHRYS